MEAFQDVHGDADSPVDAGTMTIAISLDSDPRRSISNVEIADRESQLRWAPGNSLTAWLIDSDSQTGSGYCQVIVQDNTAV